MRRRGRPRKPGGRHPNGQLKRRSAKAQRDDITAVARRARQNVFGLSAVDAARAEAGDMLGRLAISGEITPRQLAAGRAYEQLRRDLDRALQARHVRSSSDYNLGGGYRAPDTDETGHAEWVARVKRRYTVARSALLMCSDPMAAAVVDGVVVEGREMWNFVGTLRIGLNALDRVISPR